MNNFRNASRSLTVLSTRDVTCAMNEQQQILLERMKEFVRDESKLRLLIEKESVGYFDSYSVIAQFIRDCFPDLVGVALYTYTENEANFYRKEFPPLIIKIWDMKLPHDHKNEKLHLFTQFYIPWVDMNLVHQFPTKSIFFLISEDYSDLICSIK